MKGIQNHLRTTFLTGIFAVVPVVVTVFIVVWIDTNTRFISERLIGKSAPFLGVLIAVVAIYVAGLIATSLIGKYFIRILDSILSHVPVLKEAYSAWKQIALTPGGTEGTYSKVVLVPDETGRMRMLGFTSGRPVDSAGATLCVFIPSIPNPITGRLYFVSIEQCEFVSLSPEEAFKILLSTGNYVPRKMFDSAQAPAS